MMMMMMMLLMLMIICVDYAVFAHKLSVNIVSLLVASAISNKPTLIITQNHGFDSRHNTRNNAIWLHIKRNQNTYGKQV